MLIYLIIGIAIIFLYRTLSTGLNYHSIKTEADKFENWLNDKEERIKAPNGEKMRFLLGKAGITESQIPYVRILGPRSYRNDVVDALKSYPTQDRQILKQLIPLIYLGIDTLQYKFRQNFNPMFWVDFVIFLPKHIISYLGLNTDNVFAKLLNIIYWLITPILVIFRDRLWDFLINFFSQ